MSRETDPRNVPPAEAAPAAPTGPGAARIPEQPGAPSRTPDTPLTTPGRAPEAPVATPPADPTAPGHHAAPHAAPADTGAAAGVAPGKHRTPVTAPTPAAAAEAVPHAPAEHAGQLFPQGERDKLALRLQQALGGFVDEPRGAVREAASVLEDVTEHLTATLTERRRTLRAAWDDGDGPSGTEELRIALRTYREMTERLLKL
ncbi:hypothetical protein ABT160_01350 [Streptomyces sp. NPDC001941]|uniref:hypothetical protein n=1 Tax=Streptomyces sp. NPDC001941 TaxID=3154659 RepID=UPI00332A3022